MGGHCVESARVSDDGQRQVVAGATCHHLARERDDVYL